MDEQPSQQPREPFTPKCQYRKCQNRLPINRHPKQRYCAAKHRKAEENARAQDKKNKRPVLNAEQAEMAQQVRDFDPTEGYERFVDEGWAQKLLDGEMSQRDVAAEMAVQQKSISSWFTMFRMMEEVGGGEIEDWEPPEWYSDDPVEDFAQFRSKHFQTETGEPYGTPDHQRRWIRAVYETWERGGYLVILSPPRHGKTDLLIHFCIWLVVRFPNIRILYIGGSQEIAEYSVGSVKDHLEHNETLYEYLPPMKKFKPKTRSGKAWTTQKFTVATRTVVGMKAPTMKAVGRGGRILSLDADLIITDDPEDHDTTINPGMRAETRGWWAKSVMSRKMEHTGVMVIGSRVHPDDLVGNLAAAPEYESIVEQAHDEAVCTSAPDQDDGHDTCMLWPEKRSYRWLRQKKDDPIEGEFYEMVYQNRALDDEMATFKPEDIDACMDRTRYIGHRPKGTRLIGGLDPSVSGHQAAFLWAYDPRTGRRYMVDIDNRLGGGIEPALEIMQRWHVAYGLDHWVIEENLYHGAIREDEKITKWAQKNYVHLEGHETWGTNKWDRYMGVTSMARYFRDEDEHGNRLVSLPAADHESRAKSGEYRKQLLNFNRDVQAKMTNTRRSKAKSDIVMAAWFPEVAIRRWVKEEAAEIHFNYTPTQYPFSRMTLGRFDAAM